MTPIRLGSDGFACDFGRAAETVCTADLEETISSFPSGNTVIGSAILSLASLSTSIEKGWADLTKGRDSMF